MDEENRGERTRAGRIDRGDRRERGMPQRGATATYEDKFRRLMLVVAGTVLEPSVPIPPALVAQARASLLALVHAEFGDELNSAPVSRETPEDDTWPGSYDDDDAPF